MAKIQSGILCLFVFFNGYSQNGISHLKKMHSENYLKWHRTMTFVQTTKFYRGDTMFRQATWYEALRFPYNLRIDYEDPQKGNFVLYGKDSTHRFQNKTLRNATSITNPFIFFIGGMYFIPFDSVVAQLAKKGYDVNKGYKTSWQEKEIQVVGRNNDKDTSNAIWIDTKNKWIVRIIEKDNSHWLDAHLKEQKKLPRGWSETKVDIYIDGKLIQVEEYSDIKTDIPLDDKLFDPVQVNSAKHWYNK